MFQFTFRILSRQIFIYCMWVLHNAVGTPCICFSRLRCAVRKFGNKQVQMTGNDPSFSLRMTPPPPPWSTCPITVEFSFQWLAGWWFWPMTVQQLHGVSYAAEKTKKLESSNNAWRRSLASPLVSTLFCLIDACQPEPLRLLERHAD